MNAKSLTLVVIAMVGVVPAAVAGPSLTPPVIYYRFDQDHSTAVPAGSSPNGQMQIPVVDFTGTQNGLLNTATTTFDTTHATRSFFFDNLSQGAGTGSGIGDGLAKFGVGALHLAPSDTHSVAAPDGAFGHNDQGVRVLGDRITSDGSYVVNSTNANLFDRSGTQEWTLEFWFRALNNPGSTSIMMSHGEGVLNDRPNFTIQVLTNGTVQTILREDGAATTVNLTSAGDFADTQWQHIAVVRSVTPGGTNNDFITIYINDGDGTGVGDTIVGETLTQVFDESITLLNWGDSTLAGDPFSFFLGLPYQSATNGTATVTYPLFDIDDFAYFNAALPLNQIGYDALAFVPEPASCGLLALGVLALGSRRLVRSRRS
jgi:hypothetical protein